MTELSKAEQELLGKITRVLAQPVRIEFAVFSTNLPRVKKKPSKNEKTDQILALIKKALPELAKEAGWQPPEEVKEFVDYSINQMLAEFSKHTSVDLDYWAKANGYVKLSREQNLSIIPRGSYSNTDYLRGQSSKQDGGK